MASAPTRIGAIPISPAAHAVRSRSYTFGQEEKSRYEKMDLVEPKNAIQCKYSMEELLGDPTKENLETALKVYAYAKKQCLFTPMGCSYYSGDDQVKVGNACREMAAQARKQLEALQNK